MSADIASKVVLITGASAGIGRASSRALAGMGAEVIVVGRDEARTAGAVASIIEATGNSRVTPMLADLSSMASVRHLASQVRDRIGRLDVLINNAGAMFGTRRVTAEGFERTWALNHLGCLLLTIELLPLLRSAASGRVVNVSSQAHATGAIHFDDLQLASGYGAMRAYAQAKLAQVLSSYALARRLVGTAVTVNCLHPGVVATDVAREMGPAFRFMQQVLLRPFSISPQAAARTTVYVASAPEVEGVTGEYFEKSAQTTSSAAARDVALQERVMTVSLAQLEVSMD